MTFDASKVGNEITFLAGRQLIIGINVVPATGTTRHVFKVRSGEPLKITHKR